MVRDNERRRRVSGGGAGRADVDDAAARCDCRRRMSSGHRGALDVDRRRRRADDGATSAGRGRGMRTDSRRADSAVAARLYRSEDVDGGSADVDGRR